MTRALEFYNYAIEVFGEVATDPRERVLRFIEEAIELAQAAGIDQPKMDAMLARVYGRPHGNIAQEFGQCMVTLEIAALRLSVDLEKEADAQLVRFKSIPAEHWRKRQDQKKQLGLTSDA
jgi:NTP pyrophosphatase (non-canonical NTP hydrolase)